MYFSFAHSLNQLNIRIYLHDKLRHGKIGKLELGSQTLTLSVYRHAMLLLG